MTFHIHIQGVVQGVGFRPYAFRVAETFLLRGSVCNAADGVHIEFNADETTAQAFYKSLLEGAPILSQITQSKLEKIDDKFFENGFKIIHSDSHKKANLLLTPDFALCEDCKNELKNTQNNRFQYPFITCTNCGPRYSIIEKLPYDRENTTMDSFKMCPDCEAEYKNVYDRRFYSQTNSCITCGVELIELSCSGNFKSFPNIVPIITALNQGKIIAIKGIGGFLLMCDATNETAIQTLRDRKHRSTKPFAVMYPTIEMLENDVILRGCDKQALSSPEAPILLLSLKNETASGIKTELIAPNLSQIGAMLPYTPLFALITAMLERGEAKGIKGVGKPLIATSANISGSPIIFKDDKANEYLSEIADLIISNNREIVVPQDDSVLKYSFFKEKKIIIRRSRGYAPTFIQPSIPYHQSSLALGAMMKSSFSWAHEGNMYVSQYLGDLESYETQACFEQTLKHFLQLFDDKPSRIITDKHPAYFSTELGEHLAAEWDIPLHKVQHHKAHFAAVMAENGLLDSKDPILGVIWDGTGLGDDGNIWGGEFFKYHENSFLRCYYFDYFPLILGDKMPKEPRISALSLAHDVMGAEDILSKKFSNTALVSRFGGEEVLYRKLLKQEGVLQTSSVGRLFDGVASLLDLGDKMSYEGEAAMLLEDLALSFFKKNGLDFSDSYISEGSSYYRVPTKTLIQNIVFDIQKGKSKDLIAAKFHVSLVKIIQKVARNVGCKKLAFSGGVFQNGLLVDLILHHLNDEFELFFHKELSPNDENISLGQIMIMNYGL